MRRRSTRQTEENVQLKQQARLTRSVDQLIINTIQTKKHYKNKSTSSNKGTHIDEKTGASLYNLPQIKSDLIKSKDYVSYLGKTNFLDK